MKTDILLDVDSSDPHFELYSELGNTLVFKNRSVMRIAADEVDFVWPFVRIRLDEPENHKGLILWIPSQRVIFGYADDSDQKRIGFAASFNTPPKT